MISAGAVASGSPWRASVWLADPDAGLWAACLDSWVENGWKGYREFPTWDEAMDYALDLVANRSSHDFSNNNEGA